jgi:hypothetical protein
MRKKLIESDIKVRDLIIVTETYASDTGTSTVESVGFVVKMIGNKIAINSACIDGTFNENDPINRWIDAEKFLADPSKKFVIICNAKAAELDMAA